MVSAMNGFIAGTVFIWPDGGCGSLRLIPGKALFFRRGAQTFCLEEAPAAVVGVRLGAGVCASPDVSLRPTPGKALFFRREAQTFHREKPPAAVRVCAPHPGKPYSTVEGRKPFTWKRRRRLWEFAPHTRESLVPPSRGANFLPGRGAGGCESLRLTPGKALFHR